MWLQERDGKMAHRNSCEEKMVRMRKKSTSSEEDFTIKLVPMQKVIEKIQKYMKRNKLTKEEFTNRIGISDRTLHRWCNKETKISRAYLYILEYEGVI